MWPALISLVLAFPPMSPPADIAPHHFGTPFAELVDATVTQWDGAAWAFWVDTRRDTSLGVVTSARADLWMAQIGPDGNLVGDLPKPGCLAPPGVTFEQPRAVTTRTGVVVAWVERNLYTGGAPAVRVAPMNASGQLVCPAAPQFSPGSLLKLELGTNGDSVLVGWSNPSTITAQPLSPTGAPYDGGVPMQLTPGGSGRPAIAGTDAGYVVSWVALDAGVLSQPLPGSVNATLGGRAGTVALVERPQGTAEGTTTGSQLLVRILPSTTTQGTLTAPALTNGPTEQLLVPWGSASVLALGWGTGGAATWSIGTPGTNFPTARDFVSGYVPRAATAFGSGALAIAQATGGDVTPLAAFVLPSNAAAVPSVTWDGGSVLSSTANQWNPSAVWANGWWMVGHDEAEVPELPGPEFHQWRLDPDGALSEAQWVDIRPTLYRQLLAGGGRVALLGEANGETTLNELTHSGDQYAPGPVIARAGLAFRYGAVGALDSLLWAPGTGGSFTARHTTPQGSSLDTSYTGVPGRCAALVERTFYVPVWSGPTLQLLAFDGASGAAASVTAQKAFSQEGEPACAAANGSKVLVTWSGFDGGIEAVVFDTATSQGTTVAMPGTDSGDRHPVVAAGEGGWVLAWEAHNTTTGRSSLHGTFVDLSGNGEPVVALGLGTVHTEVKPSLASSPTGQVALAWSTFDEVTGQTVTRVRVIGNPPIPPDAGTVPPDGGTLLPDGGTLLPDGGTLLPDGGTLLPDGGVLPPDGGVAAPDAGSGATDGGTGDDGLVQFESCGCGAVAPSSLWLLALAALRWRRSARRGR